MTEAQLHPAGACSVAGTRDHVEVIDGEHDGSVGCFPAGVLRVRKWRTLTIGDHRYGAWRLGVGSPYGAPGTLVLVALRPDDGEGAEAL